MNDLEAIFGEGFDPNAHKPAEAIALLPPGNYNVIVEKAETKATRTGTGHILAIVLKVLDGDYVGRKLFHNINVDNPSPQCVQIGLGELASLSKAIGVQGLVSSSAQLLGVPVSANVRVKDGQNNVRAYAPAGPATPGGAAPPPSQAQYPVYPAVQYGPPPVAPAPAPVAVAPVAVAIGPAPPAASPQQLPTQAPLVQPAVQPTAPMAPGTPGTPVTGAPAKPPWQQ